MPQSVFAYLVGKLEIQIELRAEVAAKGGVEDWPAYQKLVGEIYGLQMSVNRIKAAEKRVLDGDDEDN